MFTRALLSVTGIAEHPELFRFFEIGILFGIIKRRFPSRDEFHRHHFQEAADHAGDIVCGAALIKGRPR